MDNIITLYPVKNEARIDSRIMAEYLDIRHKNVLELVDKYPSDFEELGRVAFQTRPFDTNGGPQKQRVALLNEDQAYLLLTFSRNTRRVRGLKVELVKAFARFRRNQQTDADYLPFYHELHDEVKALADRAHQAGSTASERVFHINVNRAINEAFGLESGQRPDLPRHLRAKVTAANVLALELLQDAADKGMDHKAAYQHVKNGVLAFAHAGVQRLEAA